MFLAVGIWGRTSFRRGFATLAGVTVTSALVVQCAEAAPPTPSTPAVTVSSPANPPAPLTPTSPASQEPQPPAAPAGATVQPVTAAELGPSWRPECPVAPDQLRRVELDHIGFSGQTERGELIVHVDLVPEVIEIFEELHGLHFPIEKMRTVEHYPNADDELSMRDNNTSAFNCRGIPGSDQWSWHAYGRAIDINPLLNPYIDRTGAYEPRNAGPFLDRNRIDPGLLKDGDPAVRLFTDRGWRWGGHWRTPLDYQHFERRP